MYNLPIPKFGISLGLLGRNGIGKSTALEILGNKVKMNLGKEKAEEKEEQKEEAGSIRQSQEIPGP